MRFDAFKYDGALLIGARRDRGIWVNQIQFVGSRVVRNGGRLNNSATSHTLLAIALLSALRSISLKAASELLSKRHDGRAKPVLLVRSIDRTFLPSLAALMRNAQEQKLRAAKSLYGPLVHQLTRFKVVFETERDNNAILACINFASKNIFHPTDVVDLSPALVPSVTNGLSNEFQMTGDHVRF
jgi:hypothetical protein